MNYKDYSCEEFVEAIASKEPMPGGGGASAMVAAIGISLGNMVANLTIGKKKYELVEDEISKLKKQGEKLQAEFLELIDEDAINFKPLHKIYSKKDRTQEEMEQALVQATLTPLKVMQKCKEAMDINKQLLEKGSKLVASDAQCGISICYGAMQSAYFNVLCNTQLMKNRKEAEQINKEANLTLERGLKLNMYVDN